MNCFLQSIHGYRRLHQTTQKRSEHLLSSSHRWRRLRHDQRQIPTRGYSTIFFYPSGAKMEHPTKSEICVTFDQWDIMKTLIAKLHKQKPYLLGAVPCFKQPDHVNLMTVVECNECNPSSDALNHNPLNFFSSWE